MKNFIVVGLCMVIAACSASDSVNTVKDTGIDFFFVDENGNDLLDPNSDSAITEENTDLYYLEDGEKERVYESHLDSPKMFFVSDEKRSGNYFMRVFPNIIRGQEKAITYLKFENGVEDTIEAQYVAEDHFTVVGKVWYNGELKWDGDRGEPRIIEMVHSAE